MKKPGLAEVTSARIAGLIHELSKLTDKTEPQISENLGYSAQYLGQMKSRKKLGDLTFLEVTMLASAAGYEIQFWKRGA